MSQKAVIMYFDKEGTKIGKFVLTYGKSEKPLEDTFVTKFRANKEKPPNSDTATIEVFKDGEKIHDDKVDFKIYPKSV